ncbi:polyhydroxyalkanoate synthase [Rhizorhapis suberifaciens]|uniref:Polyhydroxyalkanoate synthase n=1 Tax=Rhizorhapis suberifaciens TaxID=13656 RepID=A0A840HXF2_9SPHN|nr:polyhydroxyalkanoate synthase [Rhizorhapis suberifaciens]
MTGSESPEDFAAFAIASTPNKENAALAPNHDAPQHGPRPLPLFLDMLWRETQNDTELRLKAFAGLRKYQNAARHPREPKADIAARAGAAQLLHYRGTGRPTIFIPSLINPHIVLDLSDKNSLMEYLRGRNINVYLVDWGEPSAEDSELSLADHVEQRLLPLLSNLPEPPILVGYCLGGTMAAAAAGLMHVAGLSMIAAPWNFGAFPHETSALIAELWKQAKPMCERLGYVPMEVLQSGFWGLDPARTIRKYATFAELEDDSEEADSFIRLEDWANEGAPLTLGTGRELFEQLYGDNETGSGRWLVGGKNADPATLEIPFLNIISETDKIVPASTACKAGTKLRLASGHVGMIVGGRAREQLWQPLADWLLETSL